MYDYFDIQTLAHYTFSKDVTHLHLNNKNLDVISDLSGFTKLKILYIRNNNLKVLPFLPDSLEELYCDNNQLTTLSPMHGQQLPKSLKILKCNDNQLTCLDDYGLILPNSLTTLFCCNNKIKYLPDDYQIPLEMKRMEFSNNCLEYFPYYNQHTLRINITNNPILIQNYYSTVEINSIITIGLCKAIADCLNSITDTIFCNKAKERMNIINANGILIEEAAKRFMHPDKIAKLLDSGMSIDEIHDLY